MASVRDLVANRGRAMQGDIVIASPLHGLDNSVDKMLAELTGENKFIQTKLFKAEEGVKKSFQEWRSRILDEMTLV